MKNIRLFSFLLIFSIVIASCNQGGGSGKVAGETGKLKVVSTTTMITDLLNQIAGDKVEVFGLMGPGVDPHLYKASEGDVSKLFNANIIIYNGLHLEGKMVDLFEKMHKQGKKTIAVAKAIPETRLISVDGSSQHFDPHIWFSVSNWKLVAKYVAEELTKHDPGNAEYYSSNGL